MMKLYENFLNLLQLLHRTIGCAGKKCECPGCTTCCCGKREDTKFCCAQHRSIANNKKYSVKYFQSNENRRINNSNTLLIEDLFNRGFHQIDKGGLDIRGFDFAAYPIPVLVAGREMALFADIGMWCDSEKIYHLVKIK